MKIIIANGPPGSGKDTIIKGLRENLNIGKRPTDTLSYKLTLCQHVGERYGLTAATVWQMNDDRDVKDEPTPIFDGKSVRQALQYESEEVIKKKYGEQGVAKQTIIDLMEKWNGLPHDLVLFCTDGGFNSELDCVKDMLPIHPDDIFIIRMLRNGCSFDGDTREFLNNPNFILNNNGTMSLAIKLALAATQPFINKTEIAWKPSSVVDL